MFSYFHSNVNYCDCNINMVLKVLFSRNFDGKMENYLSIRKMVLVNEKAIDKKSPLSDTGLPLSLKRALTMITLFFIFSN